jgi:amino acid transporter
MDDAARGMSSSTDTARTGDTERLHEMGYAQELKRSMSGFSNFAISFTIISILSGCLTLFGFGMFTGGPASSAYGWLVVGFFVTFVGLAMAEVCSSYPTAGGLYYWSARLAKRNGPAWAWFTGWFNMLGQVAITAGIDFGLAAFICAFMGIAFNVDVTKAVLIVTYTLVLAVHGLLNTFGVRLVAVFNNISVWWHVFGVLVIVGLCIFVPDHHTSLSTIYNFSSTKGQGDVTGFINGTLFTKSPLGIGGVTLYVFMIGMLLAAYTITGYDASAHMTEETHDADISGPKGIWKSIVISVFFGYILLIGVWYALNPASYANILAFQYPATGNIAAPAAIFLDSFGKGLAIFAIIIVMGAQFFCGMASVTANSRMIYAFSRDGAVPGHRWWHSINKRTRTPTNAIWLAAALAWLLVAPAYWLGSIVAYFAVTAVGVIGLYIAYTIPIYLRLRGGENFKPGPWSLGSKGKVIGWVAVLWVIFISIVLCLPQYNWGGTTGVKLVDVFNFTPVVVGGLFVVVGIWWLVSARKWFTGPKVMGTPEELAAIERELGEVG